MLDRNSLRFDKTNAPELIPWPRAVLAGITGAFVATLFLTICNQTGWALLNLPFLIGSIFIPEVGPRAWNLGFLLLVLGGAPLAIFYRAFFRWARHINIGLGLIVGFVQWMASGLVLGLVGPLSKAVPEQVPAPGPYGWSYDIGSFAFFMLANLVFGLVVTFIEQRRRRRLGTVLEHKPENLRNVPEFTQNHVAQ